MNLIGTSSGLSVVACYMLARFGMGPGGFGTGLDLCSDSGYLSRTLQCKGLGPALPGLNTHWERCSPTN